LTLKDETEIILNLLLDGKNDKDEYEFEKDLVICCTLNTNHNDYIYEC
jgi:hypothetical protein